MTVCPQHISHLQVTYKRPVFVVWLEVTDCGSLKYDSIATRVSQVLYEYNLSISQVKLDLPLSVDLCLLTQLGY